jgi:hypothetical protein
MQFLRLTLIAAALTGPLIIAASGPADAAKACKCSQSTQSGCTEWNDCHEVLESAPSFRQALSTRDCRHSQMLVCDGDSCKLVCYSNKQPATQ